MVNAKRGIFSRVDLNRYASEYRAVVEQLAEQLRPQFAAGILHGYRAGKEEEWEDRDLDARGRDPIIRLEDRVQKELVRDFVTAYLILAVSPAERQDLDGGLWLENSRGAAAECIVIDAFRLARERGWWRPRNGEYIGNSEWERLERARARRAPAAGRRSRRAAA